MGVWLPLLEIFWEDIWEIFAEDINGDVIWEQDEGIQYCRIMNGTGICGWYRNGMLCLRMYGCYWWVGIRILTFQVGGSVMEGVWCKFRPVHEWMLCTDSWGDMACRLNWGGVCISWRESQ